MADRGHKYSREGCDHFQGLTETGDWLKVTQLLPGGARTPLRSENSPLQADTGICLVVASAQSGHSSFSLPPGPVILGMWLDSAFAVLLPQSMG